MILADKLFKAWGWPLSYGRFFLSNTISQPLSLFVHLEEKTKEKDGSKPGEGGHREIWTRGKLRFSDRRTVENW